MSIARRLLPAVGLVALLLALASAFVYTASESALDQVFETPPAPGSACAVALPEAPSPVVLAHGRTLVRAVTQCTFCHAEDLGGEVVGDDPLIGRVDAPNLTRGRGGFAGDATFCDWDRSVRRGVRGDGRSLLLMPSRHYAGLSDADLVAIASYLRSVPPVDRVVAPRRIGWLSRVVTALGQADDVFSARGHPTSIEPTGDGGRLIELGLCRVCHKADLSGGLHPLALPEEPVPPPLVGDAALAGWSEAEFARAMREGRTPDGRLLDRHYMPWTGYAGLADAEVAAIWDALRSLDPSAEAGAALPDVAAPPPDRR